jgi:hypothetical protein
LDRGGDAIQQEQSIALSRQQCGGFGGVFQCCFSGQQCGFGFTGLVRREIKIKL